MRRDEVDSELAFHVEMTARELEASGMDRAEARLEAERRLGDMAEMRRRLKRLADQRDRSRRRAMRFEELGQDVRQALRQLGRAPGFAVLAIATLALGIGSTTGMFSVVNAVILRSLPYPDADRLVEVHEVWQGVSGGNVSAGNFVDGRELTKSFAAMGAGHEVNLSLVEGDAAERVRTWAVTHDWFEVFGVRPALGRTFTAAEDSPGADGVVVMSHAFWSERFEADTRIVGREIRLGGRPRTVIGVMPAGFDPFEWGDRAWVPVAFTPERRAMHDEHYLIAVGRLAEGVTLADTRLDLDRAGAILRERYPQDNAERTLRARPLSDVVVGPTARARLLVLMGAVTLVLLIACGNVANLLLARGASRAREMAVRGAIGASRGRIVRQLVTESGVLALVAASLGAALASAGIGLFARYAPPGIPRLDEAGLDATALLFALGAATITTILAGTVPALRASRISAAAAMREGHRGASTAAPRDRMRTLLIGGEVALAFTLLVGAGLLIRSALAMERIDPGFDLDRIMTARVTFPPGAYADGEATRQSFIRIADDLDARPGIRAAAVSQAPMGAGGNSNGLVPEGRPLEAASAIDSRLRVVTSGYFETLGVRIVAGRPFDESDAAGSNLTMIVSETLARRAWPGEDPIGRRVICCEGSPDDPRWKTVVGVAADVRSDGPAVEPRPEFYLPITQAPVQAFDWMNRTMTLVVRPAVGEPAGVVPIMRDVLGDIDPGVPLHSISSMSGALRRVTATARFNFQLLTALGITGLLLAVGGIYGVVAFFVGLRRYEIGVRIALGATGGDVIRLMMRQGFVAVLGGIVVGIAASLASSRVLGSWLVAIEPTDPLTYSAAAALMLLVGAAAAFVPARRATRVEPTESLSAV
jgi:predicted permease